MVHCTVVLPMWTYILMRRHEEFILFKPLCLANILWIQCYLEALKICNLARDALVRATSILALKKNLWQLINFYHQSDFMNHLTRNCNMGHRDAEKLWVKHWLEAPEWRCSWWWIFGGNWGFMDRGWCMIAKRHTFKYKYQQKYAYMHVLLSLLHSFPACC